MKLNKMDVTRQEQLLKGRYGSEDLAEDPAFKGGYINFGYWKDISYSNIDDLVVEDRIKASENLYKLIFEKLNIKKEDNILEVGCGRGYGAVCLTQHHEISSLLAIDITPDQIERANKIHKKYLAENTNLLFKIGSSHAIPTSNKSINKIYSVEALQHFYDVSDFAREAFRVLAKGGKIVITAHLPSNIESYEVVKKRIPVVGTMEDKSTPIMQVQKIFKNLGFKEEKIESVGEHVFEGCNRWREKVNSIAWTREFLNLYKEGHLDYYILNYTKK